MGEHKQEGECGCFSCFLAKRVQFADGQEVRFAGHKALTFIDVSIIEDKDGSVKAALGFDGTVRISYILAAIGALTKAAYDLIGQEYVIDGKAERN